MKLLRENGVLKEGITRVIILTTVLLIALLLAFAYFSIYTIVSLTEHIEESTQNPNTIITNVEDCNDKIRQMRTYIDWLAVDDSEENLVSTRLMINELYNTADIKISVIEKVYTGDPTEVAAFRENFEAVAAAQFELLDGLEDGTKSYDEVEAYIQNKLTKPYYDFNKSAQKILNRVQLSLREVNEEAQRALVSNIILISVMFVLVVAVLIVFSCIIYTTINDLRRADSAKTSFLSSVSHDMRTPLNGILGYTELAASTDDVTQLKEYNTKVRNTGQFLLSLINDTLDLSRIESGKITLKPAGIDLRGTVAGIAEPQKIVASEKGLTLETSIDDKLPQYILADKLHFEKIILNLVSNSVRYTEPGGKIFLGLEKVSPVDGCELKITVSDTGIGIGEEFIPILFVPFAQEHSDRNQGTGLGLAIVHDIIEKMHGTISVDSKLGEGTTFTVLLPLEEAASSSEAPVVRAAPTDFNLSGKKILVCEDNDINIEIVKGFLEARGMEVVVAKDGQEGVDKFKDSEVYEFDCVLMDIRMPVMDGIEATRQIRALGREDSQITPIVALSADAFSEDVEKRLSRGFDEYITKPVSSDILYAKLAAVISEKFIN